MGKEQLRQFILEYLSPGGYKSRLQQSANMQSAQTANKTGRDQLKGYIQAMHNIDDLASTRAERVNKVKKGRGSTILKKPTRLSKRGFDDSKQGQTRNAPERKPSSDLGRRLGVD